MLFFKKNRCVYKIVIIVKVLINKGLKGVLLLLN